MQECIARWLKNTCLLGCFFLALGAGLLQAQEQDNPPVTEDSDERININEADAGLIADALDGVGSVRAEAIIRYREENGEFRSLEEVGEVSGVGEQTLMRNSDKIVFD